MTYPAKLMKPIRIPSPCRSIKSTLSLMAVWFGCLSLVHAQDVDPAADLLFVMPNYWLNELGGKIDTRYTTELEEHGITSQTTTYGAIRRGDVDINQFRALALLYARPSPTNEHSGKASLIHEVWPDLMRYVERGGGLLLFPRFTVYAWPAAESELSPIIDYLGAGLLPRKIVDEDHQKTVDGLRDYRFFSTTQLTPHPITEGIEQIWYPEGTGLHNVGTFPLEINEDWTVLVRGEPSARAKALEGPDDRDGAYDVSPPFMAVREYGAGRVVLFTSDDRYWIVQPYWLDFDGHALRDGGFDLLLNTFHYLIQTQGR